MTPTAQEGLVELAERVEAATGPSYALDCQIWDAIYPGEREERWQKMLKEAPSSMTYNCGPADRDGYIKPLRAFTASIDAALTLQPAGVTVLVEQQREGWRATMWADRMTPIAEGNAATEALARAAAALRARSTQTRNV